MWTSRRGGYAPSRSFGPSSRAARLWASSPGGRGEAYGFVRDTLERLAYRGLYRAHKGLPCCASSWRRMASRAQQTERRRQWPATGQVRDHRDGNHGRRFTPADIRLLADIDEACGQISGLATREILRRQFEVFGDARFERLATISNGHLYNLCGGATYRARRTVRAKTQPSAVSVALRQAPEPEGQPGHVRVDTVHQCVKQNTHRQTTPADRS